MAFQYPGFQLSAFQIVRRGTFTGALPPLLANGQAVFGSVGVSRRFGVGGGLVAPIVRYGSFAASLPRLGLRGEAVSSPVFGRLYGRIGIAPRIAADHCHFADGEIIAVLAAL